MTRLKFSAILLGATALTLPMGTSAFAQQTQQGQTQVQQGQQQGQQGQQQAAVQQGQELGACEVLYRLLEDAANEQLLEEFRDAGTFVERGDADECALIIERAEAAGGISEEAVAERRGVQYVTERETFRASDTVRETVEVEVARQAIVEGEVLVSQPIPQVEIEQGEAEVQVRERAGRINIEEQPASIEIRQQPANVRVAVPRPTITIEQPAPEIVVTMPAPGLSVERDQPQVDVVVAEPTITVTQDDPQVEVNVEARLLDEAEMATVQGEDRPRVLTRAQRVTAAGQEATEDAEVAVRKVKPSIRFMTADVQDEVTFNRARPRITYQAAEPNVEVTFNEEPRVEIRQVGEARVRVRREGEDQSMLQGQQGQQAQQGQGQQATMQVQQGQQGTQTFAAEVARGEGSVEQIEARLQTAGQALQQQDAETARAEIEQVGRDLDMAMQQADPESRQQMQAMREQVDYVLVEIDEQDMQGAQTAFQDVDANFRQNRDLWIERQAERAGSAVERTAEGAATTIGQGVATVGQGVENAGREVGQRLSIEDTNRFLAAEEGVNFGEAQPTRIRAGDLRGADVHTVRGEEVGDIEEIVTSNGQLYAIVEHGGFLGIGGDQVAIPLERIAMRGDEVILLGLTEEQLQQMPNYDFERDQEFSATQEVEIGRFE